MKKLIFIILAIMMTTCSTAQTKTCTREMAAKIAYFLKTEKIGYMTFYLKANRDEAKALQCLNDLPKYTDYADRFIFEVVKYYGVRSSYDVMTTCMKFTLDECVIAKEIYEQYAREEENTLKEQRERKEAEERILQDEIINGKVLSVEDITFLPQLHANIRTDSLIRQWDCIEEWDLDRQASFVVEVCADKEIKLVEGNRTLFDALQINVKSPAYKRLKTSTNNVPCACRLDIKLKTEERSLRKAEETIYYNKKKGWYTKPRSVQAGDKRLFGYNIYEKNYVLDEIYRKLAELGNDGNYKQGLCKVQIYKRALILSVGDKVIQTGEAPNSVQVEFIMQPE